MVSHRKTSHRVVFISADIAAGQLAKPWTLVSINVIIGC